MTDMPTLKPEQVFIPGQSPARITFSLESEKYSKLNSAIPLGSQPLTGIAILKRNKS